MPAALPARRLFRWARHGAVVLGAGLLAAACASSSPSSQGTVKTPAGADAQIVIKNFQFTDATVAAGSTVTVVNDDSATHNVFSTDFSTDNVQQGHTVTFVAPTKPGIYDYDCSIHTYMHGTLTVVAK